MVDPIFIAAIGVATLGAWELLTGRPLLGRAPGNLSERGTRLYGASSLALSLGVIALAASYPTGLAFMTFGIGILILVATTHLVTSRKATS
jgi:hypothetical protein